MAGIIVVNKSRVKNLPINHVYVGRPSVLGNPFSHKDSDIAIHVDSVHEAMTLYRKWLENQWKAKGAVYWEMIRLARAYKKYQKLTLVCWCKPEQCHGDILADAIIKLSENKKYCPSEEE